MTDDWHDTNNTMTAANGNNASSFVSVDDARGFGLRPVRDERALIGALQDKSQDIGSSVDSAHMGLASGAMELRGVDLTPAVPTDTEDRGFDLQPAEDAPGFSLQPVSEARGLDLKPAVDTMSESVAGGRGFDLQVSQEGRGFSLQPVANLLHSEGEEMKTEGEGEEDEDDDTPPPESLQSIKNIARARKSAGKDAIKKSTEVNATAKKTSKTGKEKPSKKSTEKPQHRKDKGKVGSSSIVDKSHLFKPSPSSAPSWSPTPTMRSTKTKARHTFLT